MESTLKAVILVGGKGTRLRPLTFRTPKPLMPVCNRAFLEFTLDACLSAGIDEVVLSTQYLPGLFEESFPGGTYKGLQLTYVNEEQPLDTAGAVKNAEAHLHDTFLVFNGDVLSGLPVPEMIDFHAGKGATATIYLKAVADPRAFGLVPLDAEQRVLDFLEKPDTEEQVVSNLINAGCYVLEPSVLELIPPGSPYSFERGLFPALLDAGEAVYGYPCDAYWIDVGTPANYLQAHSDLLGGALAWRPPGREAAPGVFVGEGGDISTSAKLTGPVLIGTGVTIGPEAGLEGPVVLGNGVTVEGGSRVAGAVVHDRARIGPGCEVEGSIIGREAVLRERVTVTDCAVVGPGADIEADNELRRGIRVHPDVVVAEGSIRF